MPTPIPAEDYGVELLREVDGRWIGVVPSLRGVVAYGATPQEARNNVLVIARNVRLQRAEKKVRVTQGAETGA